MLRVLFWFSSTIGLGWLCWHFAAWRVAAQVALVWVFFLWVVLGGWLVSRSLRERPAPRQPLFMEKQRLGALSLRQSYASQYGEDAANEVDKRDPGFWMREAGRLAATK